VKKFRHHLGEKIKRLRSYRGMTQEELAKGIGKTRSLISFLERTGNINKYTLSEIARVLNTTPTDLEKIETGVMQPVFVESEDSLHAKNKLFQNLIERQQNEIEFLKQTISHQQNLLYRITNSK
jgi:transcriptional regulator with XRE-family HTH domain